MSQNDNQGWGPEGRPLTGGEQNPPHPDDPARFPQSPAPAPNQAPNQFFDQAQSPPGQLGENVPNAPYAQGPADWPEAGYAPPPAYGAPAGPAPMYGTYPAPGGPGGPFGPQGPPPAYGGPANQAWPPPRGGPPGHPVNRAFPPPPPRSGPNNRSFLTWPLVVLLLGILMIGGCVYNVGQTFSKLAYSGSSSLSSLVEPGLGVLVVQGEIFSTQWAIEVLEEFEENDKIKALVLRVDSPGGAVAPCQELYRALQAFTKPVVVSMGSVAASGGLYIAVAGNHIMANPGTITGSIGVIMETIEFDQAMDKLGIKAQVIKSGQFKDMGSPFRAMRPEEQTLLQNMVLEVYEQFVADVATGRPKLNTQQIRQMADGRVFTGQEALKQGLIDEYGGLKEALNKAKELGGIPPSADPEIIYEDGRYGLIEQLFGVKLAFLNKVDSTLEQSASLKFIYRPGLF